MQVHLPETVPRSKEKDSSEGASEDSGRYRAPRDRVRRGVPRSAVVVLKPDPINVSRLPHSASKFHPTMTTD